MRFPWPVPHPPLWTITARATCRFGPLMALLLVLVVLAGCMRVQRSFTLNSDGSGVYVLTIGVRYPKPGDPTSIPAKNTVALEAFGAHVQKQGGSYRRYDEQGYTYWSYTRPFTSVSQADALLREDPRQDDQTHFPVLYHDTLRITTHSWPLAPKTYQVTGTISLADLTGDAKKSWLDATESLTITLPGGVRAHQGGVQDGNSVTYTIGYNQTATVDVTGSAEQAGKGDIWVLAVVLAVVALALAAVGAMLLYRATHAPVARPSR